MAGGNSRGPLPGHLAYGRGNFGGPVLGGQLLLCAHAETVTGAEAIYAAWQLPLAVRIHAFCNYVRDVAASTLSFNLYKNSAASLTGATSLLTGVGAHTTNVTGKLIALVAEDTISSNIMLTRSTRDVDRGQWLIVSLDQAAGSALDVSMQIVAVARGHASNQPGDD